MYRALQRLGLLPDPLPPEVLRSEAVGAEDAAIRAVHFPEDPDALARARDRLKFDELFALELGVAYRKRRIERTEEGVVHESSGALASAFLSGLPFELTSAQRRAIKEIGADMETPRPMNRLLQGDVGSGKTVVALAAALAAVQSGHQATIMAPTEVLAGQHLHTAGQLLAPIGGTDLLSLGHEHLDDLAGHRRDEPARDRACARLREPRLLDQREHVAFALDPGLRAAHAAGTRGSFGPMALACGGWRSGPCRNPRAATQVTDRSGARRRGTLVRG